MRIVPSCLLYPFSSFVFVFFLPFHALTNCFIGNRNLVSPTFSRSPPFIISSYQELNFPKFNGHPLHTVLLLSSFQLRFCSSPYSSIILLQPSSYVCHLRPSSCFNNHPSFPSSSSSFSHNTDSSSIPFSSRQYPHGRVALNFSSE